MPPRSSTASEYIVVRSALLVTTSTSAGSNLLEAHARNTRWHPTLHPPSLSSFAPLASHTPPTPPAKKVARSASFKWSLERSVLVEFRTPLKRGEQDGEMLLRFDTESFLHNPLVSHTCRRPLFRPRNAVRSRLATLSCGIQASDRIQR